MRGTFRHRFRSNESLLNRFFLLLAGAAAGVTGGLVVRETIPVPTTLVTLGLFVAFSLMGFAIPPKLYGNFVTWRRYATTNRRTRLGILSDLGADSIDVANSAWALLSAREWLHLAKSTATKRPRLAPRLITSGSLLNRYHCVLNPYGGVFPEENTATRPTFGRILDYAANGGFVVNVADLPTYFMFDPQLHTKVDASPLVYTEAHATRPFTETPMLQRLSLFAVNLERIDKTTCTYRGAAQAGVTDAEAAVFIPERAVVVDKNVLPIISMTIPTRHDRLSPLFVVPFGKGGFLFCMYWFGDAYPANAALPRILIRLIAKGSVLLGRPDTRNLTNR